MSQTRGNDDTTLYDSTALEQSLAANLQLQATLQRELTRIATAKARNRHAVAATTRQLLHAIQTTLNNDNSQPDDESLSLAAANTDFATASSVRNKTKSGKKQVDVRDDDIYAAPRKWYRRFFYDHKSRHPEPEPNPDTQIRRDIEANPNYFFYHIQKPWSNKENEVLVAITREVASKDTTSDNKKKKTKPTGSNSSNKATNDTLKDMNSIDFDVVAATLEQKMHRKVGDRTSPRTPNECRIQYQNILQSKNGNKENFSKAELQQMNDYIHLTSSKAGSIDFEEVADKLSTDSRKRTAWECFVQYRSTQNKSSSALSSLNTTTPIWTVLEDELLLKFIAAAGPQTIFDSRNILLQHTLLNQLITTKSKKQILSRMNQSLLNPNLLRCEWSEEEERRLPIFMKIYHNVSASSQSNVSSPSDKTDSNVDSSNKNNDMDTSSSFRLDLFLASTHCYGRSTKSVVDKWHRSMNPNYSTRPFTANEDQKLLYVMRSSFLSQTTTSSSSSSSSSSLIGWKELSEKHFPHRHPQRLLSRWSELASDSDILNRERAVLLVSSSGGTTDAPQKQSRKRKNDKTNASTQVPIRREREKRQK